MFSRNGHDYSAIMSRKAELGYSGVGYGKICYFINNTI